MLRLVYDIFQIPAWTGPELDLEFIIITYLSDAAIIVVIFCD